MGEKWESDRKAEIPLFEGKFIKITGKQELFIASEKNSAAMRGIDRWSWIFVKEISYTYKYLFMMMIFA